MKRLSIFVFILSFVVTQSAFAETAIGTTSSIPLSPSSAGTNKTAKEAKSGAGMAQIANQIAAAGFFAAAAAAPPPQKPIYLALAAASVAAGMMMGKGKSNAGAVDKSTLAVPSMGGVGGTTTPGAGFDGGEDGISAELRGMEEELAGLGYVVSPDGSTISTPSGQVSTAAIAGGNAPGFEMTDDVKAKMDEISADALAKASGNRVVPIGLQDGGGGGGGGSSGGGEAADGGRFDMAKYLKGLKNRDPSSVSGLSKKLGEDNIGIMSDNIFEMVSRQYKRKQSQSAFIK